MVKGESSRWIVGRGAYYGRARRGGAGLGCLLTGWLSVNGSSKQD